MKTTEYSYYDRPDLADPPKPGRQAIMVEYIDMTVDIGYEVRMVDISTFVSSVGGALGLFLGFSIIDTLLYLYKHIFKMNT